jgi:hypothetical protein
MNDLANGIRADIEKVKSLGEASSSDYPAMVGHVDQLVNEAHDHFLNFKKYIEKNERLMKKHGRDVKALEKALNDAVMASSVLVDDMETP